MPKPNETLTPEQRLEEENIRLLARVRELESENARLREAFEHACETAEEFYDFFESHRMLATDPEDSEICAMRRNREELLG